MVLGLEEARLLSALWATLGRGRRRRRRGRGRERRRKRWSSR